MDKDLSSGTLVDNRYQILSSLGEGGMGRIYKALELELNRVIALKTLLTGCNFDEVQQSRFAREGRLLAEVSHANLGKIYRFAFSEHGPYIAMEYLEGRTLRDYLDHNGGRMPARQVIEICEQVCDAMQAVHDAGIVHRDLKPGNIMLTEGPVNTKVIDFGLARALVNDEDGGRLTQTGALIGSIHYMSPEQCIGRRPDSRSDIYSLGCVMYEALSGSLPAQGDNPVAVVHQHATAEPRALSTFVKALPCGLEEIVARSLKKEPSARYQSMSELKIDLQRVKEGQGKDIAKYTAAGQRKIWFSSTTLTFLFLAVLCIAGVVYATLQKNSNWDARSSREQNAEAKLDKRREKLKQRWARASENEKRSGATLMMSSLDDLSSEYFQLAAMEKAVLAEQQTIDLSAYDKDAIGRTQLSNIVISNYLLKTAARSNDATRVQLCQRALTYLKPVDSADTDVAKILERRVYMNRAICFAGLGRIIDSATCIDNALDTNKRAPASMAVYESMELPGIYVSQRLNDYEEVVKQLLTLAQFHSDNERLLLSEKIVSLTDCCKQLPGHYILEMVKPLLTSIIIRDKPESFLLRYRSCSDRVAALQQQFAGEIASTRRKLKKMDAPGFASLELPTDKR